jgi:hypothetical protein
MCLAKKDKTYAISKVSAKHPARFFDGASNQLHLPKAIACAKLLV